jgi:hypothetical protein
METEKDILMYFHTSIRNMGLYTSLSFGALGYSRFYRGKNPTYNIYLIAVSLAFTFISIYTGICAMNDLVAFNKKVKSSYLTKWEIIPIIIIIFNIGTFFLSLSTLYSEISSKTDIDLNRTLTNILF